MRDDAPREFDGVPSPHRGAQSGDAETSKTRTRRRIMTSRAKERGSRVLAMARVRTTNDELTTATNRRGNDHNLKI